MRNMAVFSFRPTRRDAEGQALRLPPEGWVKAACGQRPQAPAKPAGGRRPDRGDLLCASVRDAPRIFRELEGVESAQSGTEGPFGVPGADGADAVERALAGALTAAADAGRWDVVERLARELGARRKAARPSQSFASSG